MHNDPIQRKLTVSVFGPFVMRNDQGDELKPKGKKEIAICALLASAEHRKRSRSWLKQTLWSDRSDEQASVSLRRALSNIRKALGDYKSCLESDRLSVWWNPERVHVLSYKDSRMLNGPEKQEFLDGIDVPDTKFDKWLLERRGLSRAVDRQIKTLDRSADGNHSGAAPNRVLSLEPDARSLSVVVYPVRIESESDRYIADTIADVVVNTIDQQRFVNLFDLRHVPVPMCLQPPESSTIGLSLRLLRTDGVYQLSVSILDSSDGRVLWTRFFKNQLRHGLGVSTDYALLKVSSAIANSVYDQVFAVCKGEASNTLASAMHQVLTHSRDGQDSARAILSGLAHDSGVARAWLMYTYAVAHAERHGGLGLDELEELDEHCRLASTLEPANPIVQAIVGHITAFVFRRQELAQYHHERARKLGWNQPIVWALSAMHANYTNRPEVAYRYSSRALAQSEFSPYRYYFEGPHSISCSLTNRHQEAIAVGRRALATKPGLLAVMRHMAASQIMTGQLSQARQTVDFIRTKDQQYTVKDIVADDYPLPSNKSVQLIEHALNVAGLNQHAREI